MTEILGVAGAACLASVLYTVLLYRSLRRQMDDLRAEVAAARIAGALSPAGSSRN